MTICTIILLNQHAPIAQLVERNFSKVKVSGSTPLGSSFFLPQGLVFPCVRPLSGRHRYDKEPLPADFQTSACCPRPRALGHWE